MFFNKYRTIGFLSGLKNIDREFERMERKRRKGVKRRGEEDRAAIRYDLTSTLTGSSERGGSIGLEACGSEGNRTDCGAESFAAVADVVATPLRGVV